MRCLCVITVIALMLASVATQAAEAVAPLEARDWTRWTVPLPKSIKISGKVTVPVGSVAVNAPESDALPVGQAAKEIRELVGPAPSGTPLFTITLALGGADSEPLGKLKNADQSYCIIPAGESGLKLVALSPRGLYYAAQTLQQLIRGRSDAANLTIPLLTVTDWPDMADRGLWGSDNHEHLKWLAQRKMNWMEQISDHGVDAATGETFGRLKGGREPLIEEGPYYGINPVPVVLHLEQSGGRGPGGGALKAFPFIKGQSKHGGVMCYSQPKTIEIISDWIYQLGTLPHVTEVDVWMSENLGYKVKGCQCEKCVATGVDPQVLEARAILKAREMAEARAGKKIGLRMLTSEATEDFNPQIIAELPKDVILVYYHSLRSYTCDKKPMVPKYLADFARRGGKYGMCPNIASIVGFVQPFESAEFIHYRMKEFLDKGCMGLLGYATPRVNYTRYNTEASAEYTWNVNGRSPREFAASWAVREGIKDPEKFADYAEAIGPVLWDMNGTDWPMRALHKKVIPMEQRLKEGTMPGFGEYLEGYIKVPFGNFRDAAQLDDDVAKADRAVRLADEMGIEEFKQIARIGQGYADALKALYELTGLVRNGTVSIDDRPQAARYFNMYVDGFRQAMVALPKWEATVRNPGDNLGAVGGVVKMCRDLINNMIPFAASMGVSIAPGVEQKAVETMKPIYGSFLQLDGSNLVYTREQWQAELQAMRDLGMDTLIIGEVARDNSAFCKLDKYPMFAKCGTDDPVQTLLDIAKSLRMQVFVGLYAWNWSKQSPEDFAEYTKRCMAIADEVWQRYGGQKAFGGWYCLGWEIGNTARLDNVGMKAYLEVIPHLRQLSGRLPILIAPYFTLDCSIKDWEDGWKQMLPALKPNFLALQDGVGCGRNLTPENVKPYYEVLNRLCEEVGVGLWADIEVFDLPNHCAAPPERVLDQIRTASQYAERNMIFEFNHYMSPNRTGDPRISDLYDAIRKLQGKNR